jgi:DnaJ family protein C protein 13
VRLFLKDPKFPLRNPKRFLEGLLDQYVAAAAATHGKGGVPTNPELPLLLSAALVSLLRVQPMLADHVGHLGYVPKLVAAMANEGRREVMSSSGQVVVGSGLTPWEVDEDEGVGGQTAQGRARPSCSRVLHQLAASTTCAEAMATPGMGTHQVHRSPSLSFQC